MVSSVTSVSRASAGSAGALVRRTRLFDLLEMRWAVAAGVFFLVGFLTQWAGAPTWLWWGLYLACYLTGGWEPGLAGVRALRERTLDVDLLMVVAAIGAAAIGQITDGALLIVIFASSGAMEALATARTEDSIRGLLDLAPETATVRTDDGDEHAVQAGDLAVGQVIVVRPGERIAADGTVLQGASEVDQAGITGEPLAVDKTVGDEVFAGTLNGSGMLGIRVDRRAADSVVARIALLVAEASRTKARTQLFVEKIEQHYSIGMVVATLVVLAVPLCLGAPLRESLLRAMTFMIVASPCAVVLATMPPMLAAIANAGRHGVLVKSAVALELLGAGTRVAFDKTGTLTEGHPELTDIRTLPESGWGERDLLRAAAAVELHSEHHLAAAVVRAARADGIQIPVAQDFVSRPGLGVRATVDGELVAVESPSVAEQIDESAAAVIAELEQRGRTAVVVTRNHLPVGVLAVADRIRPEAPGVVAALAGQLGAAPVLLTGDNRAAAQEVARAVGITEVHAGLLPADKVAAVRMLEADGHRVLMVGDGLNDAPALAAAHCGIAMGAAGSDLTLQAADVVVLRDDLTAVLPALALARRARRVVLANLGFAAAAAAMLVAWDLIGQLPLPLGVAGHEGSTVVVALNGLRLLRRSAWPKA